MTPEWQAIFASTLSSFLGLAGGFLLLANYHGVKKVAHYLVSFAAGALLGAAFFDLLHEGIHEYPDQVTFLFSWVLGGFLLFFLIEKLLLWHHHSHSQDDHADHAVLNPLILIGDAVHNFIDGTIIAAAFLVNPALGVTTAVAVLFHELPQEIGDFSILIFGGMARKRVAVWNLLGALVSPLGTVATLVAAQSIKGLELPLLGLAAGNFIYIAAADLVPQIHRHKSSAKTFIELGLLIVGILVIVGVGRIFPHG